jgi:threonine/homoserine/homoserine lactone efflux protein
MSLHDFLVFLPACFALNLTFGPNNLLSLTYGARFGVSVAWWAGLGRITAFVIMITISGLGMGTLLMASQTAFTVVKLVGAAYLVWLGLRLLRASTPLTALPTSSSAGSEVPPLRQLIRQEFMVAIGNPKAILIFSAFLPQFVVPSDYAQSFTQVAITFLLLEWLVVALYAGLGQRMSRWSRGAQSMRWFNRISGALMVGFGLLLALARRPQA